MDTEPLRCDRNPRVIADELLIERLTTRPAFNELLDLAWRVCLAKSPPPVEALPPATEEQRLIMQLGARGLRDALTLKRMSKYNQGSWGLSDDAVIRHPERFGWGQDREILQRVEAFGAALLDEAYVTLGDDVEEKIAEFQNAKTIKEKEAVINWVDRRLGAMSQGSSIYNDDGSVDILEYHPIRLSPKCIGVYPDVKWPPTCLGNSIIAASFFRKAGAPVMHAGVVRSAAQEDVMALAELTASASSEIDRLAGGETELSQALRQRKDGLMNAVHSAREEGYHVVSLVKLEEGVWYQIDPSRSRSTPRRTLPWEGDYMPPRNLDEVYDSLQEFKDIAPNLEIAIHGGSVSVAIFLCRKGFYQRNETLMEERQTIAQSFLSRDTKTLRLKLQRQLEALYRSVYDDATEAKNDYFGMFKNPKPVSEFTYESGWLIDRYVFYGKSPEEVAERCQRDEAYLQRRVDDVLSLLFAVRAASPMLLSIKAGRDVHRILEIGNAEMRVGFAVLSDVATFLHGGMDSDMSSGFWHSNWPSSIPASARAGDARTEAERYLNDANRWLAELQTLTYYDV